MIKLSRLDTLKSLGDLGKANRSFRCGHHGLMYGYLTDLVVEGLVASATCTPFSSTAQVMEEFWLTEKGWAEYTDQFERYMAEALF